MLNITRFYLFILSCFFTSTICFAQQAPDFNCAFDGLRDAAQEREMKLFEEQLHRHFLQKKATDGLQENSSGMPYVVPVVVHIIHNGGSENISDARVIAAIEHLNEAFAAQGYFAQKGAMTNTQIQFCLAKRDPDGNATSGITRTQSPLTNMVMETEDLATKDLSRWAPTQYVNIWVVKEITSLSIGPGVAGYAYFPNAHGQPKDGMICEAQFFGTSPAQDAILVHEMGHYFGLYHTFEGGCKNDDCTVDGDRVCDTPPDNAKHTTCPFNSCSTDVAPGSPFSADVDDFTGDFMDYSPFQCYYFFTQGQASRMQGAVETARKSLLSSKGCLDPCTQPITAAFSAAPNPVFIGQPVQFTNNSTGANAYAWSENGVVFSQNQNPTQVFNAIGNFLITLNVTNADPNCSDTATLSIQVKCPVVADFEVTETEISPGTTLFFTNSSTGGATSFEWSINGATLATTTDFSYLFSTPGFYYVKLQAVGTACGSEKTLLIYVKSPCGDPFFVKTKFNNAQTFIHVNDMVGLPDGSVIQGGSNDNKPMLSRLDAAGNLMWNKVLDAKGYVNDIEPLLDGNYILHARADDQLLLAKMDANGNITWFRTLEIKDPFLGYESGKNYLAANPDGSFIFYYRNPQGSEGVGKMSADGNVDWLRRYNFLNATGGLRRATDGSGDVLVSSNFVDFFQVLRINQSGDVVNLYRYNLPQEVFYGGATGFLDVLPDGGFSFLVRKFVTNLTWEGYNYLIRCQADGQALWAKKIFAPGDYSDYQNARYLPGEGWLLFDSKVNGVKNLIRLDEQDEIVWKRRIGTGTPNFSFASAAIKQNGIIRAVKNNHPYRDFDLLQLPDAYLPIPCLPDDQVRDTVINIAVQKTEISTTATPQTHTFSPAPYTILNIPLEQTASCPLILPCPEICDNGLDDDEDGFVDCLDTDCPCSDPDTACVVETPLINNFSAKLAWQSSEDATHTSGIPFVANLNPQQDSIPEIIVLQSIAQTNIPTNNLLIFHGDGSNASSPNILTVPQGFTQNPPVNPTVADLDGNGIPELIVITIDGLIRVYTEFDPNANPCMKLWAVSDKPSVGGTGGRINTADFDSDGIGEIFSGANIFKLNLSDPLAPKLIRVLSGGGAQGNIAGYPNTSTNSTAADLLTPADCNGDPDCDGLEIAAGYHIYSVDLDLTDGDGYQIKVQRDLQQIDPNGLYLDGYSAVADLDLDGTPEVIVSSGRDFNDGGFYVWNKNGAVHRFTHPSLKRMWGMICVADVYDDRKSGFTQNFPELIVCQEYGLFCFNLQKAQSTPAEPFWWSLPTTDFSGVTGVTVFDFNGDGLSEIVYRDQDYLRILYGGLAPFPAGVDAERNWFKTITGSLTLDEYPVVADVDNDGEAEIAVTGYTTSVLGMVNAFSYQGRLRIFESADLPWQPARPIWNQYNYFSVNINDDLTVPKVQQKHWLEVGGIGSGNRPFNTHLAQVSSLNPLASTKTKVPDASIALDSSQCRVDSIDLYFSICNFGSTVLPGGTPIAFYAGDPTASAASLLFPPIILNDSIENGACVNIQISIPASFNQTIFAVVNDDGSLPPPFDLANDFPATSQAECHYENNLVSFSGQHQTPLLDLGPDMLLCKNSVVELSAGPGFINYRWQDGSTEPNFTAFGPGKYWVDAFDACGFKQTDTVNIELNVLKTLNLPEAITVCEGEPVHLSATGFPKYNWAPGDSVSCADCPSVEVLAQSSTTIYLTASDGDCFVSDSVQVEIYPKPIVNFIVQNEDCDSIINITANAIGAGPFSFLWSNSETDSILNISQTGTYQLETVDQNGCRSADSISISIPVPITLSVNSSAPACHNSSTGSIDLTVSGGVGPFQFLWSNNVNSEDLDALQAGIYSVLVSDANGCTASISTTLDNPPAIVLSLEKTEPICAGQPSGALNLTAGGGTGNLTFEWSNNSTLEDLDLLLAGTYSATVTDENGCTATISETLIDPPAIVLSLEKTEPVCNGQSSGTLDLTASGGTGSLTFEWSNNSTLEDLDLLSAGTYSATVTDQNGCTASISETITDPPAIVLSLEKTDPVCNGQSSGTLDLTASGGTGNLTFLWSNNSISEDLDLLPAGTYSATVTDQNSCTATISETLAGPPAIVLSLEKTEPTCAGQFSGMLDLTATGGTGNLTFLWSNNSTTEDLDLLPAGVYSATVTDQNSCTATISETLVDPPAIVLSLEKTEPVCAGQSSGTIDLTATGGTGTLQFNWSNNSTAEDLNLLSSGIYSATVTDQNGCTGTISETLIDPPAIVLQFQNPTLSCPGDSGLINLAASGGAPPITFLWSNGATSASILVVEAGTYTVTSTDSKGCTVSDETTVTMLGMSPELSLQTDTLTCIKTSGFISAQSNLSNCTFLWSGPGGFSSSNVAPAIMTNGLFSVTVTEPSGGCTAVGSVFVQIDSTAPTIVLAAPIVEIPCDQQAVIISAAGSSSGMNYSIQWTAAAGGSILNGANSLSPNVGNAGFYDLLITNLSNGCTATSTVEVLQSEQLTGLAIADSVRCFGETNGAIRVISTLGGTPPLTYSIDNQHFKTEPLFENLTAGTYQLIIRDANGCTFLTEIIVAQPAPIAVKLTGDTLVIRGSEANLNAIVFPPDFVPAQIVWEASDLNLVQNQLTQSTRLLENTIFKVEISSENGCTAVDTRLVRVDANFKVYIPNAIFPENPKGTNQTFVIYTGPEALKIEFLEIFDRWGNLIFRNKDFLPNVESSGWDGTYNGKAVGPGVYVWAAKIVFKDASTKVLKGDLTVIR